MTLLSVLFFCFIGVVVIQILFYSSFLSFLSFLKPKTTKSTKVPISLIICVKNDAENLKENLPEFISQDYKDFEIVLINDNSYDDTLKVMEAFKNKYGNIKIVDVKPIEPFWGNKKYALTLGIKAATHNFLVFTEPDCKPSSDQWLSKISAHFSNSTSIVLGFSVYKKIKYSFLNFLIRFDNLFTAVQYFSYAKLGIPYMGVGRNLAYHKSLFFDNGGYMSHMKLKAGDDDLFINQVATKKNTSIAIAKDSFTYSTSKLTFKDWLTKKRIHANTTKYYKFLHRFLLSLFYCSQLLFWTLGIILLSFLHQWEIVVGIIIFRVLLQWMCLGISAKKLNSTDLIIWLPILEIFLILLQLVIFSANMIRKPKYWR